MTRDYRRWYAQADARDLGRKRRDDDLLCHCDKPMPMPVRPFGNAMGGLQECQRCGRPVAGSEPTNPMGPTPMMIVALTSGQRLVVAVVFLIAIVVLCVWPIVRPPRARQIDEAKSWHRLMREIRRQR